MRTVGFALISGLLLIASSAWGQSNAPTKAPQPGRVSDSYHPTDDPQAVTIVNQALAVAGGRAAVMAIMDFTATGTMTMNGAATDNAITLTVRGRGLSNFRIDTNVSSGVASLATFHGKTSVLNADGSVTPTHIRASLSPTILVFPHQLLAVAVEQPFLSLFYKGQVEFNGRPVHDIRVQPTMVQGSDPKGQLAELSAVDILIDTSTFQILATRDMVRTIRNMWVGTPHEIQYSDYRTVDGVSLPYSMSESIGGQAPRALQVISISVNSGLADTQFQLQAAKQ